MACRPPLEGPTRGPGAVPTAENNAPKLLDSDGSNRILDMCCSFFDFLFVRLKQSVIFRFSSIL